MINEVLTILKVQGNNPEKIGRTPKSNESFFVKITSLEENIQTNQFKIN